MEISVEQVRDRMAADAPPVLLDCREPGEWQHCRIDGAMHIPMTQTPGRLGELSADRPIVVYCHHGVRSLRVAQFLRERGYDAASMAGGIEAWSLQVDPTVPRY